MFWFATNELWESKLGPIHEMIYQLVIPTFYLQDNCNFNKFKAFLGLTSILQDIGDEITIT
jgi:hypothetical protein